METKKSIVSNIVHNTKQWNSPNGTIYFHEISFMNNDKGQYGSKESECKKFVIGKEADYTIETKTNGQYTNVVIKPVSEQTTGGFGGGFKNRSGNESFALSYAKDIGCALITSGRDIKAEAIIQLAEAFYVWLQSKKTA